MIHISSRAEFAQHLATPDKLIVVDWTAEWCGPCKMIAPQFTRLASEYADKAVFLKVDVDANRELAQEHAIKAMPTFHFWKNGDKADEVRREC